MKKFLLGFLLLASSVGATQFFFDFNNTANYSNVNLVLQRGDSVNATNTNFSVLANGTVLFVVNNTVLNVTTVNISTINVTVLNSTTNVTNQTIVINTSVINITTTVVNVTYVNLTITNNTVVNANNSGNASNFSCPSIVPVDKRIEPGEVFQKENVRVECSSVSGARSVEKDLPVESCYAFSGFFTNSTICAIGAKEIIYKQPDDLKATCSPLQAEFCPAYCALNPLLNNTNATVTPTPLPQCVQGYFYDLNTRSCLQQQGGNNIIEVFLILAGIILFVAVAKNFLDKPTPPQSGGA